MINRPHPAKAGQALRDYIITNLMDDLLSLNWMFMKYICCLNNGNVSL